MSKVPSAPQMPQIPVAEAITPQEPSVLVDAELITNQRYKADQELKEKYRLLKEELEQRITIAKQTAEREYEGRIRTVKERHAAEMAILKSTIDRFEKDKAVHLAALRDQYKREEVTWRTLNPLLAEEYDRLQRQEHAHRLDEERVRHDQRVREEQIAHDHRMEESEAAERARKHYAKIAAGAVMGAVMGAYL